MTEQELVVDHCRYCGRNIGDAFAGSPDDLAPGVCAQCIDARMCVLTLGVCRRMLDGRPSAEVKTWLRTEMLEIGIAPSWAQHFIDADYAAFAAAGKRLRR